MSADWRLQKEQDKVDEENRQIYAEIAAKLVILGYDRHSAIEKVKEVNENREYYRNDLGVHIEGDEYHPSQWTIDECNYPKEISGEFNPGQVHKISQELIDDF